MEMLTNHPIIGIFNGGKNPADEINLTKGLCLIGEAQKGPSMTLIKTNGQSDYQKVVQIFGPNSQITNGFMEAASNGADKIYLIRSNGKHREIIIKNDETNDLFLSLYSVEANEAYNDVNITYSWSGDNLLFNIEWPLVGTNKSYIVNNMTFKQLADKINSDALINLSSISASQGFSPFIATYGSDDKIISFLQYIGPEKIVNSQLAEDDYNSEKFERIEEILEFFKSFPISTMAFLNIDFDEEFSDRIFVENIFAIGPNLFELSINGNQNIKEKDIFYFKEYPQINLEVDYISKGSAIVIPSMPFTINDVANISYIYRKEKSLIYNLISDFCNEKSLMLEPCIVVLGHTKEESKTALLSRINNFLQQGSLFNINKITQVLESTKLKITPSEYIAIPIMANKIIPSYQVSDEIENSQYVSNGVATISAIIDRLENYENFSNMALNGYLIEDLYDMNKINAEVLSRLGFITGFKFNNSYYLSSSFNLIKFMELIGENQVILQELSPILADISNVKLLQDFLFNIKEVHEYIGEAGDTKNKIKQLIKEAADSLYPYIQKIDLDIEEVRTNAGKEIFAKIKLYFLGVMKGLSIKVGVG